MERRLAPSPLLLLALLTAGCSTRYGQVLVDRPEVFSRERLVVRRHEEVSRLEKELARPQLASQGVQGLRDFRQFTASLRGLGARLGDGPGTAAPAPQAAQAAATQAGTAAMEAPAPVSKPLVAAAGTPDPRDVAPAQVQLTGVDRIQDEEATRSFLQAVLREKELDDTHDLLGLTIYTLKFDVTLIPTREDHQHYQVALHLEGGDTERERLFLERWIESLGRSINSEVLGLQRRWLQDAVSEEERISLALQASREIQEIETRLQSLGSSVYQMRALQAEKLAELSRIQAEQGARKRSDGSEGRAEALASLESRAASLQTELENLGSQLEREGRQMVTLGARAELFAKVVQGPSTAQSREQVQELREALARLLLARYRKDLRSSRLGLETLVGLQDDPVPLGDPEHPEERTYLVGVDSLVERRPREFQQVRERLRDLGRELPFYAYSVEPKEFSQNISDVAARQRLRDMVASFRATLPGGRGRAGGFQEQLDRSQSVLHAIKRRPLVVGFLHDERDFGWVLGPRFAIDSKGRMSFRHGPVQYSFQASIVVPAWWSSVTLSGKVLGLDPKGRPEKARNLGALWGGEIEVLLPGDPAAFTGWALHQTERRPPTLVPHWTGSGQRRRRRVRAGQPASFLLRGSNLWRNPQVYLGSTRADRTEILPDMGGLQAHFDQVPLPPAEAVSGAEPGERSRAPRLDLTVVTSNGISTLPEEVEVLPASHP